MDRTEEINDLLNVVRSSNYVSPDLYETYNVKRGLRNSDGTGVLVGLTAIGDVHGYIIDEREKVDVEGRLSYRGINLYDIVHACQAEKRYGFEETAYLLLFGKLPNKKQLDNFKDLLGSERALPEKFAKNVIYRCPSPDIMNKLSTCVLSLYADDENPDDISLPNILRQSVSLVAKLPVFISLAYHSKEYFYNKAPLYIPDIDPVGSTAENFLRMIRPNGYFTKEEAEILDLCLIIHAEHGGGNNSSFTTHVVSSTGTDTYSAISAAISSLKGPKHGGANNRVMGMMEEIKKNVKDWNDDEELSAYIRKILKGEAYDNSGLVYGMGHAIYTISDPRAVLLKEQAEKLAEIKGRSEEFNLYKSIERLTPDIFREMKGTDRAMSANVDFYSGFVYNMLEIPSELYTPIFAMSRVVGWCAHRIEEVMIGKKIMRPAYKSVSKKISYTPIGKR